MSRYNLTARRVAVIRHAIKNGRTVAGLGIRDPWRWAEGYYGLADRLRTSAFVHAYWAERKRAARAQAAAETRARHAEINRKIRRQQVG